jgi:aspartate kinase
MSSFRRLVVKFGGSVLRTGRDFDEAARLVLEAPAQERLVVVSAPFGLTDRLAGLLAEVPNRLYPAEEAAVLAYGERVSARLLSAVLRRRGASVRLVEPEDPAWPILTRSGGTETELDAEASRLRARRDLRPLLADSIVVLEGFLGREADHVTTLKRGGSDTTALALARFLEATDVVLVKGAPGVLTADPRLVPEARPIRELDADALRDLVRSGLPVVAREALAYLESSARLRVIPLGDPLLGETGTLIRPGPVGAPAGPDTGGGVTGSVTVALDDETAGFGALVRVLAGRRWEGLSATARSITVRVPPSDVDGLVRQLHATHAFRAVTSRADDPGPSEGTGGPLPPPTSGRPLPRRAGRGHARGRATSGLAAGGEPP